MKCHQEYHEKGTRPPRRTSSFQNLPLDFVATITVQSKQKKRNAVAGSCELFRVLENYEIPYFGSIPCATTDNLGSKKVLPKLGSTSAPRRRKPGLGLPVF